ncbi:MAG TPA: hypothetical protein VM266_04400, partial [Solirubrobacteraceae bacterium]|nr:hypothetical protein [Solirubrobacteraceae bacterium]
TASPPPAVRKATPARPAARPRRVAEFGAAVRRAKTASPEFATAAAQATQFTRAAAAGASGAAAPSRPPPPPPQPRAPEFGGAAAAPEFGG